MMIVRNFFTVLGVLYFLASAVVGNIEMFNRWVISDVTRPTVAVVAVDRGVTAYSMNEIEDGAKLAQGIPEGRRHK